MAEMTLSDAAKWTGKTRPTIHKALTTGRLSGRKDSNNEWKIDPAELERVYPAYKPVDVSGDGKVSGIDIGELIAGKDREIALLRELANKADETAADLRSERDKLIGVIENQTRLLTHEQEKAATMPVEQPRRRWWQRGRKAGGSGIPETNMANRSNQ